MARQPDWQRDMRDAMRLEAWSITGPNRVVKVIPLGRPLAAKLKGFVCLEKSLLGKAPGALEAVLGLSPGFLRGGCRV